VTEGVDLAFSGAVRLRVFAVLPDDLAALRERPLRGSVAVVMAGLPALDAISILDAWPLYLSTELEVAFAVQFIAAATD
jgi:hypothetical protein